MSRLGWLVLAIAVAVLLWFGVNLGRTCYGGPTKAEQQADWVGLPLASSLSGVTNRLDSLILIGCVRGNVPVNRPSENHVDVGAIDAVVVCQFPSGYASDVCCSQFTHLIVSHLSNGCPSPTLPKHISSIGQVGSQYQMFRIDARRIVAPMHDDHSRRNGSVSKFIRKAMHLNPLAIWRRDMAVKTIVAKDVTAILIYSRYSASEAFSWREPTAICLIPTWYRAVATRTGPAGADWKCAVALDTGDLHWHRGNLRCGSDL